MRFIRLKEVINMTGLGRSSIYNFMKEGSFPTSVSVGGRGVRWVESEINKWMEARIAERGEC
ncbi:helix-turn-helix transcriptional regulator [Vibrio cyclitrophicus]|uniref:helix-turn-helix transcriptional regulator n=1 Tax=Vibrio toranzoniae TaxID=1194427 RepID=UPI003551AC2B